MTTATLEPYGLTHQVQLAGNFTCPPELADVTYDDQRQLSVIDGVPLADRDDLLITCTVTWGTTGNDNKTDDGG